MPHNILIVDFGSQYTQLIARRVREIGVYSEIVPYQFVEAKFSEIQPQAVILSGGPASTTEIESPQVPNIVFESGVPVLGICYGQMIMCAQLGGKTESSNHREFGRAFLNIEKECQLFDGVWQVGSQHQVCGCRMEIASLIFLRDLKFLQNLSLLHLPSLGPVNEIIMG